MQLPEVGGPVLGEVLQSIYRLRVEVGPHNLEQLLGAASFLQVPRLLTACEAFVRECMSVQSACPLLLLAARYHCSSLRAELVSREGEPRRGGGLCRSFFPPCAAWSLS